jgi:hypothetical protein
MRVLVVLHKFKYFFNAQLWNILSSLIRVLFVD